jgi:hypothetical protein
VRVGEIRPRRERAPVVRERVVETPQLEERIAAVVERDGVERA